MKITIRLIVSLTLVVALVAAGSSLYQVRKERLRLAADMERRVVLLAEGLRDSVVPLVRSDSREKLDRLVERFGNRERLQGIAVFDRQADVIASTSLLKNRLPRSLPQVVNTLEDGRPASAFKRIEGKRTYVYAFPLVQDEETLGVLALFDDASYIDVRLKEIWKDNLLRFLVLTLLVVAITVLVVRWSITGPIAQIAEWARDLRMGKEKPKMPSGRQGVLAPSSRR
jgi:trehalose 6-phosphate synthase